MSDSKNFKGKVALITGSNSGIGESIALHLCGLGAKVVITGRNEQNVAEVAQKCRQICDFEHILEVVVDLQKDEDVHKLLNQTINKFGKLDVLVNNAGIALLTNAFDPNIMEVYDKTMNINVRQLLLLTTLAIPFLVETKGNIVNISSDAGLKPADNFLVYCMSKTSIDMMTKCLAKELGPKGIRVNAINPAAIRTQIFDKMGAEEYSTENVVRMSAEDYPLGRIGEPLECAKAVAFLASDDASFISGISMLVCGASFYANIRIRNPTRIELKLDDLNEYEAVKKELEDKQKQSKTSNESSNGSKTKEQTTHERIGFTKK